MSDQRYDFFRLDGVEKTPSGGLRIPAALTRTGVFVYKFKDGTERRELRLPEHVFNKDSLKSLKDAPVTDLHPPEMVTPENHSKYSKGHVSDVSPSGEKHVNAVLAVQDADLIKKVDARDRQELSMGYRTDLVWEAGEYEGEKYDAIQTNIRYNHAALGPSNWGRAGSTVALRLDSCDAFCEPTLGQESRKQVNMATVRIDGVEYEVGSPQHLAKLDSQAEAKAQAKVIQIQSELDKEKGRADQLTTELATTAKKLETEGDPKRIDSLVKARVDLETKARSVLGPDVKFDGKSERTIMCEVLKLDEKEMEGKSDDYLRGRFDTQIAKGPSTRSDSRSIAHVLAVAANAGKPRMVRPATKRQDDEDHTDSEDDEGRYDADEAKLRRDRDVYDMGHKPLPGAVQK